jgi:hypothetical protein
MKVVKQIGLVFLVTGVLLGIVEGCASLSIGLWEVARGPRGRQMIHARYDAELGWVNLPSVDLPDVWGPGAGVRTNSQGIRARTEFEARVAPGRIRALCSGDSFAFGEGSGDLDTWCHLLTVLDDRLETVNLGQPGYGVGQSYLRYLRDGAPLDHQIHLFTFVDGDFDRAGRRSHYGYARPLLRLVGDELEVDNVPVPRVLPAISRFARRLSEQLRSVEFAARAVKRLFPSRPSRGGTQLDRLAPLVERLFREVQQVNRDKGSAVVFVYLPTAQNLDREGRWQGWVQKALDSLGYSFIDLTPALRELPREVAGELFLPPDSDAAGHYSRAGNKWVAETLYARLRGILPVLRENAEAVDDAPEQPESRSSSSHAAGEVSVARPPRTRSTARRFD